MAGQFTQEIISPEGEVLERSNGNFALLRPHKPDAGEEPSALRAAWEVAHKYLGWLALLGACGSLAARPEDNALFEAVNKDDMGLIKAALEAGAARGARCSRRELLEASGARGGRCSKLEELEAEHSSSESDDEGGAAVAKAEAEAASEKLRGRDGELRGAAAYTASAASRRI